MTYVIRIAVKNKNETSNVRGTFVLLTKLKVEWEYDWKGQ
jgi:hypothetical protein